MTDGASTGLPGIPALGKVIAVHINYPSRAAQRGRVPAQPSYFLKPTSSLAVSGAPLERPLGTELLAFEGEIALIIDAPGRRIAVDDAWQHVGWVTASNDFGLYDLRAADRGSNLRSKGGDGFTPIGPIPIAAAGLDPTALRIRTWVNGVIAQEDSTADLLFPFARLIADISQLITLEVGDVILTGTPAGSSVVVPGDEVVVEVDSPHSPGAPTSGRLTTPVTAGTVPFSDVGSRPVVDDLQRIEAWGSRAEAGLPEPEPSFTLSEDVRERLCTVGTATLSAALRRHGFTQVFADGVRPLAAGMRLAGVARTLRMVPFRPDAFAARGGGFNAQKRAFDSVQPGEVIVIEARGVTTTGTVGDVLALRAQVRGAAGVVTDGGVRDGDAVTAIGLPVFSQGRHPSVLGRMHVPWETDVAVTCGGALVIPGDVIVADGDGVLVVPADLVGEILDEAEQQEHEDIWVAEQVRSGHSVDGLFPPNAEWRARYERSTNGEEPSE